MSEFESTTIGESYFDEPLSYIRWYMWPILFFCKPRYNADTGYKITYKTFRGKFYLINGKWEIKVFKSEAFKTMPIGSITRMDNGFIYRKINETEWKLIE